MRRVSTLELFRGNTPEAADWARRAMEADPDNPHSHSQLVHIALRSGRHAEAREHAAEALRLGAEDPAPFLAIMGRVAKASGDLPGAIGYLEQAATAAKENRAGLLMELSRLQGEAGQQTDAEASMRQAEQAEGRTSRVLCRYGDMAMARRDFDGAIGFAQDALAADPADPAPYLVLITAQMHKGDLPAAGEAARRGLEMQPLQPVPYLRAAANVALHAKNYAAASAFLDAAIAANPTDPGLFLQRSALLQRMGDLSGAQEAAMAALDLSPGRPANLLRRLGELAREAGQFDTARDWFEQALAAGPSEPGNYIVLSELHQRAGDLDRAWAITAAGLNHVAQPNSGLLRRAAQVAATRQDMLGATLLHGSVDGCGPAISQCCHGRRTYSGRPSSSIRFSAFTAIATSVARR